MNALRTIVTFGRLLFPLFAGAFGIVLALHGMAQENLTEGGVGLILVWLFTDHKPEVGS